MRNPLLRDVRLMAETLISATYFELTKLPKRQLELLIALRTHYAQYGPSYRPNELRKHLGWTRETYRKAQDSLREIGAIETKAVTGQILNIKINYLTEPRQQRRTGNYASRI